MKQDSRYRLWMAVTLTCATGSAMPVAAALPGGPDPVPATQPTTSPQDAQPSGDLTSLPLEDLMNIEVTSVSKTKQRIADAPAAVSVITQEDIQRSGLHQIPDILRLSPGIFVQQSTQLTHWSVSSRGFADVFSNKLLVLQDGRTLYTPFFSGVYWDSVDYPIADVDRIEVIRGPGATLWGANAVNGVINITTKSAKDTQGYLVDSRVGTDESDMAVRYGGKIDDQTYYRVYGKGRSFDDLPAPDGDSADNQWQSSQSGFRIDRDYNSQNTLTVQGDVLYSSISSDGLGALGGATSSDYSHDYRSGGNLMARWSHVESATSSSSLQVYYDRFNQRDSIVDDKTDTFDLDIQHHVQLNDRHDLVCGGEGRYQMDNVGSPTSQPIIDPSYNKFYLLSAFVQDTVTVVPERLKLVLGSKFEYASLSGFDLQPSVRAIWTPDEKNTVWASVARAVRTPSLKDFYASQSAIGGGAASGSSDISLENEQLIAYELGVRHQFNSAVSTDLSVFANDYDKLTVQSTTTNLPLNDETAEGYGLELAANWQVTPRWRLQGSYSLMRLFVHDGSGVSSGANEHGYPENMFQIHSYLDLPHNLSLNTSLYYTSEITEAAGLGGGAAVTVSAYTRLDLALTWKPKDDLEVSVGVQNALDPLHAEQSGGIGGNGEVERVVYAQLTWRY